MSGGLSTAFASVAGSATSTSSAAIGADQSSALSYGHAALHQATETPAPAYDATARPGDVFIHVAPGGFIGHCNIISPDPTFKIDSVDPDGVRKVRLTSDRHRAVVFRFSRPEIAQKAAELARGWAPEIDYNRFNPQAGVARVHYSSGAIGLGLTARVVHNLMGSSKFGSGAQARLEKYRKRGERMSPKNMICSELCVLAYQLAMVDDETGFPKIDAKHTSPTVLYKYLTGAGKAFWTVVGYRHMPAPADPATTTAATTTPAP